MRGDNDVCCVPENSTGCLELPEDLENLVVVWPRSPHSELNCECPLLYNSIQSNLKFEDCYCFRQNLTDYNVSLISSDRRLCWNNLNRNTKIVVARNIDKLKIFQIEVQFIVQGK